MEPRVEIIIVNWNKKHFVRKILYSLKSLEYHNYSVVVVDNASTDDSVQVIKAEFPEVTLVQNEQNLGGTGGFNSGIRYVLKNKQPKYIWILDNDADVEQDTLTKLVDSMELDANVGIAGSRLIDAEDKSLTLEMGGNLKWKTIGIEQNYRNSKNVDIDEPLEVDYVSACSALVRTEAVQKVGVMDERLFITWDDIEWCVSFKDYGYKVVAVPNSVAYHPSYTERMENLYSQYYYPVRNSLLVYTKHTNVIKRFLIFYNHFRYLFKKIALLRIINRKEEYQLISKALSDFTSNKWGKCSLNIIRNKERTPVTLEPGDDKLKKILIIADADKENILKIRNKIEKLYPKSSIFLMINNDRMDIFYPYFENIVKINRTQGAHLFYNIKIFMELLLHRFDLCILTNESQYPFVVKETAQYDIKRDVFIRSDINYKNIYKPALALIIGEFASFFLTPYFLLKSFVYGKK